MCEHLFFERVHLLSYFWHFLLNNSSGKGEGFFINHVSPGEAEKEIQGRSPRCVVENWILIVETWVLTCLSNVITLIFNHGMGNFWKNN